jgi:hypothetical protein
VQLNGHTTGSVTARINRSEVKRSSGGGFFRWVLTAGIATVALAWIGPQFGIHVPVLSGVLKEIQSGGGAQLVLQGRANNVRVFVNDNLISSSLPAKIENVPVGQKFRVKVSGEEGSFEEDYVLVEGEQREVAVKFPERQISSEALNAAASASESVAMTGETTHSAAPPAGSGGYEGQNVPLGWLTIKTTPSAEATIEIPGKPRWVRKTPFVKEGLPEGQYTIRLVNEVLGMEKTLNVTIQAGKSILLDDIRLEIKR